MYLMHPRVSLAVRWLLAGVILQVSCIALANDGFLMNGGGVALLGKSKSISMVREHIRVKWPRVGDRKVECVFVFHNSGPATTITMGFPDQGGYPAVVEDYKNRGAKLPPNQSLTEFKSWIDGRPVKVKLIKAATNSSDSWWTKRVTFKAGQTVTVKVQYSDEGGLFGSWGRTPDNDAPLLVFQYVLHTGASWRGAIGHVVVEVTCPHFKNLTFAPFKDWGEKIKPSHKYLFWQGPSKPKLNGTVLRFEARNLKPDADDDVRLGFYPTGKP